MLQTTRFTAICGLLTTLLTLRASAAPDNGWEAKLFNYDRAAGLVVEQTTPTPEQVNVFLRPPAMDSDAAAPRDAGPAKPVKMGGADIVHLRFVDADGQTVPALLCTPHDKPGPFHVVIAVHGLLSNKAQVCGMVGPELIQRGFAVLAADVPCHGERAGNPFDMVHFADGKKAFERYRDAVVDVRQLIDVAGMMKNLDTRDGVALVGYSLGSWISAAAGPSDDRVKCMVLMVGGAHDIPPAGQKVAAIGAFDPRLSMPHFAGRPLLLLNGRTDGIVKPELARRLYDACPEPKNQIWYDSGHLLPGPAYEDGAKFIADNLPPRAKDAK